MNVFLPTPKFLIVGFDGLRPDASITDDMPTLARFIDEHHFWPHYLADFPTETYVNHPSIFSGFRPKDHGLIANAYWRRDMLPDEACFFGYRLEDVLRHDAAGGLYNVPSLGDRMGERGMQLRVICANSVGSTRLQHVHAERFAGHLCAPVHALEATEPPLERQALMRAYEKGVPLKYPDHDGTRLTVDLFFERELPRGLGDVTVLWIGEPDHASHVFGINGAGTKDARRDADEAFAKILRWWEQSGRDEGVQLIVMSDHGHGTVRRHIDLKRALEEAGLRILTPDNIRAGADLKQADAVMVGSYTAGLWLTRPDQTVLLKARNALMASPDVGLLFSQPDPARPDAIEGRVPGTFSESLVFSNHPRSPDLRIVPRGNPETGDLVMSSALPIGTGNHGGLLPQEIHALLAIGGTQFPGAGIHHEPAGHADLSVTLMTMLGLLDDEASLPLPTGRFLCEATASGTAAEGPFPTERIDLTCGHFTQRLERMSHAGRTYVCAGYRLNNDGWSADRPNT